MPVAGVVAGAVAALLGVVAMRARGHSFVILTIAFLFLIQLLATNWDELTNGTGGITLPVPTWSVDYQYWPFYYSLMGLLAVSLLLSWWIRRNKFGMGLIAIREDEDKAATVGVNTPTYKILAFVASAVFVGMAGGVYGYYIGFIDPLGMFNILLSVQIILSLLLGGRATLWGPVLGAFIIEWLNETTQQRVRRRQRAAADLRRAARARRAVPAAGHHPHRQPLDRALARARQGRPGGRAARRASTCASATAPHAGRTAGRRPSRCSR